MGSPLCPHCSWQNCKDDHQSISFVPFFLSVLYYGACGSVCGVFSFLLCSVPGGGFPDDYERRTFALKGFNHLSECFQMKTTARMIFFSSTSIMWLHDYFLYLSCIFCCLVCKSSVFRFLFWLKRLNSFTCGSRFCWLSCILQLLVCRN